MGVVGGEKRFERNKRGTRNECTCSTPGPLAYRLSMIEHEASMPAATEQALTVTTCCTFLLPPSPANPPSSTSPPYSMSHANPAISSSPNFHLIFHNALNAYKKRTKKDLLAHPLVIQLQDCTSSSAVLALIHKQVQGLQRDDDRMTIWLDPTVRVLHAFSETVGEGVSLVCLRK